MNPPNPHEFSQQDPAEFPPDDYSTGESDGAEETEIGSSQSSFNLYAVDWYPMITSPWMAALCFIHWIMFFLHIFQSYNVAYAKAYEVDASSFTLITPIFTKEISAIGYALNSLMSLLIVIGVICTNINAEGFWFILGWLGSRIFPYVRFVVEINLIVAALFMTASGWSTFNFLIAAVINIGATVLCTNYNLRKDYMCCKSITMLILQKFTLILGYSASCAQFYMDPTNNTILTISIGHVCLSSLTLISYISFGYYMYRFTSCRVALALTVSIYWGLSIGTCYQQLSRRVMSIPASNNIVLYFLVFTLAGILGLYASVGYLQSKSSAPASEFLRDRIFFTYSKLQSASEDVDDNCQVRGLIRDHFYRGCDNPICYANQVSVYDSKKNKHCVIGEINRCKSSLVKFYLKCAYEKQLEIRSWSDTGLVLEYIEFLYMKLKNTYRALQLMKELQNRYLSPFQKLQLARIKRVIKEENLKLNRELYFGTLELENIIEAEDGFALIKKQLDQFMGRSTTFWRYVARTEVNLSHMKRIIEPNFVLVERINQIWKHLVKYFDVQKRWKFYFVCYTLYIKNEKIKPQFLEYFGVNPKLDDIFAQECTHIDGSSDPDKLYATRMLFEANSCCLQINALLEEPIIKNVSLNFPKIFGFSRNEVLEIPLSILMSRSMAQIHQSCFKEWVALGKSRSECNYFVKKVYPLSKTKTIIPVYKFYKQFISLDQQLMFVALLKRNSDEEQILLLNKDFEIEAATLDFLEKMRIRNDTYQHLRGLNVLVLVPGLARYSKFNTDIEQNDDIFTEKIQRSHEVDYYAATSKLVRTQGADSTLGENLQRENVSLLELKKQLTRPNMRIQIPNDIRSVLTQYRSGSPSLSTIREAIVEMRRDCDTYKGEVEIKRHQSNEQVYYQMFIRDIEAIGETREVISNQPTLKREKSRSLSLNEGLFHKQFETGASNKSVSLAFNNNIFIKEDNNKAVQMISYVDSISTTIRIFFLIFMLLSILLLYLQKSRHTNINTEVAKSQAVAIFESTIFRLMNTYQTATMKLAPLEITSPTVKTFTADLLKLKQTYSFKKAILDVSLNPPATYQPWTGNGPSYDQIDLLDKIVQCAISIDYTFPHYQTTFEYKGFNSYALPSVLTLLDRVITNLQKKLDEQISKVDKLLITFFAVESILLLLGLVAVINRLLRITDSFLSLLEIFTQLNNSDMQRVRRYCRFVQNLFRQLGEKNDQTSVAAQTNSYQFQLSRQVDQISEPDVVQNANLNKKVKKVEPGQDLKSLRTISIIRTVLFLVLFGASSFGLNLFITSNAQKTKHLNSLGSQLINYSNVMNIVMLGVKDNIDNGPPFSPSKSYADAQLLLINLKTINNVLDGSQNNFESAFKTVLFEDFCQKFPSVLKNDSVRLSECGAVASNNLMHGVQSFLYYFSALSQDILNGKGTKLDSGTLISLDKALSISNEYLRWLLDRWSTQFSQQVDSYSFTLVIVVIGVVLLQSIVYLIVIEGLVVNNLKDKYELFRRIYEDMMPEFVVNKEKIIKAKLIVEGFLRK